MKVRIVRSGDHGELYTFELPLGEVAITTLTASERERAFIHRWFVETGSDGFRPVSADPGDYSVAKEVEMPNQDVAELLMLRQPNFEQAAQS
ncbi:MAG: hypothetical protein UY71_C0010G0009 [Parcubacteria group bacterium GW2011_GWB1_52_7]|nr:MAG: hypothetical protein UY71_C0010G0009 [Parcubacteria group bacterium GW2011_GWB1_52_7]